jgi:hypothetical protein
MTAATATLRGLSFGAGTSYRWATWPTGLLATPSIRIGDTPRAGRHGVQAGADLLAGAEITFDVWVLTSSRTAAETAAAALLAAFAPSSADLPLAVTMSGSPDDYILYGRPRGAECRFDGKFNGGCLRVRAVFAATDPRRYSATEQTATTTLPTAVGGLDFAASAPFVFGSGGSGGSMSCPNDGTAATPWVATFSGPLVAPTLRLESTGDEIAFPGTTLASGETLVVDSDARTVLLDGTTSRYAWLRQPAGWFDLAAGANTVELLGASGAGSVALTWRSAWI